MGVTEMSVNWSVSNFQLINFTDILFESSDYQLGCYCLLSLFAVYNIYCIGIVFNEQIITLF